MALLHQRPKPSLWQRARMWAARRRHEPERHTEVYARLRQIGSWNLRDSRPTIKPVPANLRYFSRTVYASRAISLYTRPIAHLDWHVAPREGVKENAEIKRQIETVTNCLHNPNHDDSLVSLLQQVVEDICVSGAGVIEQQIGGDKNRPLWLWPVDALSIQIYANWDGDEDKPRYCQTYGYGNVGVAKGNDLLNRELIYMRERPTTDSPFSFGMLEVAFETINRLLGVGEYAGNVAANAHPANLILLKGASQPEIEAFRAFWRNEVEGQGNIPIVGNEDAKAIALRGADDDALYIKYQQFVIREIATAFGCSPQNLGVEHDVNRNQSEVAEDRDWDLGIKPMARLIARYINREAIWGRLGYSQIEFVPGALDREDEKATADIYKIEYEGNAITPNEYRARRNLPPTESQFGDLLFADAQIAIAGARGAKMENPDIAAKE
jgi:HK97 family phage portal protein